jgi:CheY-like chemotaxis protein
MKEFAELLTAMGAFAWPAVAAVALYFFYPFAKEFLSRDKVKIKFGEMEISAEQATEQISNQVKDLQNKVLELERRGIREPALQKFAADMESAVQPSGHKILWVDDYPSNNAIQIDKLRGDGWSIELATSTSQALEMLKVQKYDLIITDMGRKEGGERRPTAGIQLAEMVRRNNPKIPILVFTTHKAIERFQASATRVGINSITNSTVDLYRQIELAVGKK